ncbi:acyltransferase domain-containing protein, partial [Streptomyces sp. NPDC001404]|uniref:acyltransferase domain-containing protein n=1 Tax=Streptomyces sp. NPDC001404 TaxID=3364571 RepID=UPI0036D0EB55
MGHQLYRTHPAFTRAFDEVCEAFDPHLARPLRDIVFAAPGSSDAALLHRTEYTQCALFALETGLFRLFEQHGVHPDSLIGHSVGELTAAHVAGVLTLPDACELIAARGRLMQSLPSDGAMIAVHASEAEVLPYVRKHPHHVSIAAVNTPTLVVISGHAATAHDIAIELQRRGKRINPLRADRAFHSPAIEPVLRDFQSVAAGLDFHRPSIPIVSTLTGEPVSPDDIATPRYWAAQARHTVRFHQALDAITRHQPTTLLELGPDATLTTMAHSSTRRGTHAHTAVATMRKGHDERSTLTTAVSHLYVNGHVTAPLLPGTPPALRTPLPAYPFQHRRHWLAPSSGGTHVEAARAVGMDPGDHPLVGAVLALPNEDSWVLSGRLTSDSHTWLADHVVRGQRLLCATAFLEVAWRAAREASCTCVEELVLQAPLVIPERGAVHLRTIVGAADTAGRRTLRISSRSEAVGTADPWVPHAAGVLSPEAVVPTSTPAPWPPLDAEEVQRADIHDRLAAHGVVYGPAFRGLTAAWHRGDEAFATAEAPEVIRAETGVFALHPALLDAALHALALCLPEGAGQTLPFSWTGVTLHRPHAPILRVHLSRIAEREVALTATDDTGRPVLTVASLTMRPIDRAQVDALSHEALFRMSWSHRPLSVRNPPTGDWAVLKDPGNGPLAGIPFIRSYPELGFLVAALDSGAPLPGVVIAPIHAGATNETDVPTAVHASAHRALALAQGWLADDRFVHSRLVLLTHGAVATRADEGISDLAGAAVWGLLRSAQTEHPQRFTLLDLDDRSATPSVLAGALGSAEPQIAIRNGRVLVPRLTRTPSSAITQTGKPSPDPQGTVLVTGGTGTLGGLLARHLVLRHGVR